VGRLCDWVVDNLGPEVPLHFSAFHPDFKLVDRVATPTATLSRARHQALAAGVQHVFTGNVHDKGGQSTYCAACGSVLIERNWYELGTWNLRSGACGDCGAAVPGRFDERPGTWGSRRMPVAIRGV
jgi:pyruvate formate lyase activating enzyme